MEASDVRCSSFLGVWRIELEWQPWMKKGWRLDKMFQVLVIFLLGFEEIEGLVVVLVVRGVRPYDEKRKR